jgi:hypothetical protein
MGRRLGENIAIAVTAVAVIGLLLWLVSQGPAIPFWPMRYDPVNPSTFDRIKHGMAAADVHGVLGRSADHQKSLGWTNEGEPSVEEVWIGRDCRILVVFDDEYKVVERRLIFNHGR